LKIRLSGRQSHHQVCDPKHGPMPLLVHQISIEHPESTPNMNVWTLHWMGAKSSTTGSQNSLDFESSRSPTHSTGYSGSNRSTIPPFEMSAESTPAVLFSNRHSTSDCFDAGKTRPSGATRERDWESLEASAGP
jgi:hypothetical protein